MPGIIYDENTLDFQTAKQKSDESKVNYLKVDAIIHFMVETPATNM